MKQVRIKDRWYYRGFTKSHGVKTLVYVEPHDDIEHAIARNTASTRASEQILSPPYSRQEVPYIDAGKSGAGGSADEVRGGRKRRL